MNHLKDLWEDFEDQVISPELSAARLVQLRRVFYAGACGLFALLTAKLEDETISEEEGNRFMVDLAIEVNQFIEDLEDNRV